MFLSDFQWNAFERLPVECFQAYSSGMLLSVFQWNAFKAQNECFWAGVFLSFFIYHRSFPVVQNNAMDYTFEALFGTTWVTFWRHLGDFGRHLGTSWAPRGSQNRPFWHQVAPKKSKKKIIARGGHQRVKVHAPLSALGPFSIKSTT